MKEEKDLSFLQSWIVIGIIFIIVFMLVYYVEYANHPVVVKDMGFYKIVEWEGAYYIVNENECERGFKAYERSDLFGGGQSALDKDN